MDGGCGDFPGQKRWIAKYWSIVQSVNGWLSTQISNFTQQNFDYDRDGCTEGINEMGLSGHILYMGGTSSYTVYEPVENAVTWARWLRYLLDTCANVSEAKAAMQTVIIAGVGANGDSIGVHVAVEDKSGDSAIFEFVNGRL